jgi:hypothetical protein
MNIQKVVTFFDINDVNNQPSAGRNYLVIRNNGTAADTTTEVAKYMKCHFVDTDEKYFGFARFDGSSAERDLMELYGLISHKFELLHDVVCWGMLPVVMEDELPDPEDEPEDLNSFMDEALENWNEYTR